MEHEISPQRLVAALEQDYPDHRAGTRPVHSNGLGVAGTFRASDVARDYCVAHHFDGGVVPVTARFSNSSGSPERVDENPDVRGLAVKFHLSDDTQTDLVTSNLSVFVVRTPQQLLDLATAMHPTTVRPESAWRQLWDKLHLRQVLPPPPKGVAKDGTAGALAYAGAHSFARLGVLGTGALGVPISWARVKYHAVHTFVAIGPDGVERFVRFAWQPVAGVCPIPEHHPPLARDFLSTEMRERLSHAPARFILKMTIADQGDPIDDPTRSWPVTRRMVMMGTLTIERVVDDQVDGCERLSFNPMRLTDGLAPSDDIMLHTRGKVYRYSAEQRNAIICPWGHGE